MSQHDEGGECDCEACTLFDAFKRLKTEGWPTPLVLEMAVDMINYLNDDCGIKLMGIAPEKMEAVLESIDAVKH